MVNVVINHCPYIESLFGCEFVAVKLIGPTIKHYSIVLFKKHPTVLCCLRNIPLYNATNKTARNRAAF